MGTDSSIVEAARTSYDPESTKVTRSDEQLIDYLIRHEHWSPLEMLEIKFIVEAPIHTLRQWVKHNISMNEVSGRYSVLPEATNIPNPLGQDVSNKQKSIDNLDISTKKEIRQLHNQAHDVSRHAYVKMLELGQSREQARGILGTAQFSRAMIKTNLRDLLFFIKARSHETAQPEIQEYANALTKYVESWVPVAWQSFKTHQIDSIKLTPQQIKILNKILKVDLKEIAQLKESEFEKYFT